MRSVMILVAISITAICLASVAAPSPAINHLLGHYYTIQRSLASDSMNGVSKSAAELAKLSREAAATAQDGKAELLALADAAANFNAADLKSARNGFGDLSDKLIAYLKTSKAQKNPPYQYYCPMVKKSWLQPDKGARNPYYGSSMLDCGELVP